jgi:DNA-binding NarL/FixJ family response regulator
MRRSRTSGSVSTSSAVDRPDVPVVPAGSNVAQERPSRGRKKSHLPLIVIDPKPLTRQSISETFAKALPEYAIIAVSGCDELLQVPVDALNSLALVVIHNRSAQSTAGCIQRILDFVRQHLSDAPVALLSDRDDIEDVANALGCGVRGYIPTSVEAKVVFAAIRLINAGGTFVPAHAVRAVAEKPNAGSDCVRRELMDGHDLTPRELSVIDLLREGKPNKRIAAELKMQESTVKVHVRSIMKKLRVANRTHAASVANRLFGQQAPSALALSPTQSSNGGIGLLAGHTEAPGG